MVYFVEDFVGLGLQHPEILEQAGLIQPIPQEEHFHFPIVAVQGLAFAIKVIQAVGRGKLGGYFQFIHKNKSYPLEHPSNFKDALLLLIIFDRKLMNS
jgi:hypothetical protein